MNARKMKRFFLRFCEKPRKKALRITDPWGAQEIESSGIICLPAQGLLFPLPIYALLFLG